MKGPENIFFKECPNCRLRWPDRKTFLSDPMLRLIGYQANYSNLEAGFFIFNHETPDCATTLSVEAGQFADLHNGPMFETRLTGTEDCPGYCGNNKALEPCSNKCECVYVRDVIQVVKQWPKTDLKKAS